MTDDLVKRLRESAVYWDECGFHLTAKRDRDAADRIEELERHVELRDRFLVENDLWEKFAKGADEMTDDFAKRLREPPIIYHSTHGLIVFDEPDETCKEAADRIEELQDIIARIQYTNLRRDMNLAKRTKEIDKLCKLAKHMQETARDALKEGDR